MNERPNTTSTLRELLPAAERGGYAIGSFAPRYPAMILPILEAAAELGSPALVQISEKDVRRRNVDLEEFANTFHRLLATRFKGLPVGLHLDHTEDVALIVRAMDAGFSSVMIDAADRPFAENVAITRDVVERARPRGIAVEGELGTIGAAEFSETDETHRVEFTDPAQAEAFVHETGIDALAISVGTIHGLDPDRHVEVDLARIQAIRERTGVHLVLHGGSGVPADTIRRAIKIRNGGVSKVNIATDLESAMLDALGRSGRLMDAEIRALTEDELERARKAIYATVATKMRDFLSSAGRMGGGPSGSAGAGDGRR